MRLVRVNGLVGVFLTLILCPVAAAEEAKSNPPAEGFDLAAGDGIFTASLSTAGMAPGEMIRYAVRSSSSLSLS